MLNAMEDMYTLRRMLPEAVSIFSLRAFRRPSSYNRLIRLAAELGEAQVASQLLSRFFAWRARSLCLSKMRNRTVFAYRPSGLTVANVMLAQCNFGDITSAAQLLVDQEARAQTALSATGVQSPQALEKIAIKHVSASCYGVLLYYLHAPERSDEFLERMQAISIRPTAEYFSWLLRALVRLPECTEAQITKVIEQLVEWSASPTEGIYAALFHFYLARGSFVRVLSLYNDMMKEKCSIRHVETLIPVLETVLETSVDENVALDIFDFLVSVRQLRATPELQLVVMRILLKSAERKFPHAEVRSHDVSFPSSCSHTPFRSPNGSHIQGASILPK